MSKDERPFAAWMYFGMLLSGVMVSFVLLGLHASGDLNTIAVSTQIVLLPVIGTLVIIGGIGFCIEINAYNKKGIVATEWGRS